MDPIKFPRMPKGGGPDLRGYATLYQVHGGHEIIVLAPTEDALTRFMEENMATLTEPDPKKYRRAKLVPDREPNN